MRKAENLMLDIEKHQASRSDAFEGSMQDWMANVPDERQVCDLSIPGTHDSAAYTYGIPFVATQSLSVQQQLDAGIRYLDLRCGLRNNVLEMVHGPQYLGIRLQDLLEIIYSWLDQHDSEGLIIQLKKDHDDEASTITFISAVIRMISANSERWRTANTTPCMGELRGRIQLLRRFRGEDLTAYGLNVSRWQDNPHKPFTMDVGHGIRVTVQDHYRYDEPVSFPDLIAQKGEEVTELLRRASEEERADHWYINFASAFELNWQYQYPPKKIARGGWYGFKRIHGINQVMLKHIAAQDRPVKLGIIAMDYPNLTSGLIEEIVETNFSEAQEGLHAYHRLLLLLMLLAFVLVVIILS